MVDVLPYDKNNFYKKLKQGEDFEKVAGALICEHLGVEIIHYNNNYKYDILTSDNISYEIKHDKASDTYGNFFIEFLSDGKPSGIAKTEADFHGLYHNCEIYFIKTENLIKFIWETKPKTRELNPKTLYSEENKRRNISTGYIVKCKELRPFCEFILKIPK
jgi:hypothetical protein